MERQHRSEVAMRDDGAVVCGLFVDIARKQVRGFFWFRHLERLRN